MVQRVHVGRVEQRDREGDEEGQPDQHVGGRAAHRRQRADLARELLPLADGVGDHVEEPGEAASDLALDRHRGDHEGEVLGADPLGGIGKRLVHRAPEARVADDAAELLAGGLLALVDEGLDPLLEAVAGLQRGRERDEQVGKLVFEGQHPPLRLERDPEVRKQGADAERDQDPHRRASGQRGEEHEQEAASGHQVEELDRTQGHVGALELGVHLLPQAPVAEGLLGQAEEPGERREALALLAATRATGAALDVRGEAALDPGAFSPCQRQADRGQDEERDDQRHHEPAES